MTVWSLRLVGTGVIYAAVFLYETEEGAIQNRLERLWVDMQAVHDRAVSANVAFVNESARLIGIFFDRIFGPKLFSTRSCLVSYLYSAGFALLGMPLLSAFGLINKAGLGIWEWMYSTLLGLGFVVVPTLPVLLGGTPHDLLPTSSSFDSWPWYFHWNSLKEFSTAIAMSFVFLGVGAGLLMPLDTQASMLALSVAFLCAAVLSFVSDVLFIVFIRWTLRQTSKYTTLARIATGLIFICLLGFGLSLVPLFATTGTIHPLVRLDLSVLPYAILRLLALFNLVDLTLSSAVVFMFVILLIHKLAWSVMERPIYACARYDVIRNKKLLWAVGSALIVGPPGFATVGHWFLEQLAKFG
jgi:hypothetical protein